MAASARRCTCSRPGSCTSSPSRVTNVGRRSPIVATAMRTLSANQTTLTTSAPMKSSDCARRMVEKTCRKPTSPNQSQSV